MTYIENVLVCLSLPLLLSLPFTRGGTRRFIAFLVVGMLVSLLGAYVSSFFMWYYGVSATVAAIEITPVCEEVMKLLPLLLYLLVLEPPSRRVPMAAVAIAVGFATFENVCYLTESGAESLSLMLVRGISAGALHILCGIALGYGVAFASRRRWLALSGTLGILGFCIGLHGIYNLLVTADGVWRMVGYLLPSALIVCLYVVRKMAPRLGIALE